MRKFEILVPVSPGELLDKITILEIKRKRVSELPKLKNICFELGKLSSIRLKTIPYLLRLVHITGQLKEANEKLWKIEDRIRICEKNQRFDSEFIELARSVYRNNDIRAELKKEINTFLNAKIVEEKSYTDYHS